MKILLLMESTALNLNHRKFANLASWCEAFCEVPKAEVFLLPVGGEVSANSAPHLPAKLNILQTLELKQDSACSPFFGFGVRRAVQQTLKKEVRVLENLVTKLDKDTVVVSVAGNGLNVALLFWVVKRYPGLNAFLIEHRSILFNPQRFKSSKWALFAGQFLLTLTHWLRLGLLESIIRSKLRNRLRVQKQILEDLLNKGVASLFVSESLAAAAEALRPTIKSQADLVVPKLTWRVVPNPTSSEFLTRRGVEAALPNSWREFLGRKICAAWQNWDRPEKRWDLLVQLSDSISDRSGGICIVVAGPIPTRIPRRLEGRLISVGNLPPSLIRALAHMADLHLLLSDFETFSLPLAEAMAAGTPTLTRSAGGPTDIISRFPPLGRIESGPSDALGTICLDMLLDSSYSPTKIREIFQKNFSTSAVASLLSEITSGQGKA